MKFFTSLTSLALGVSLVSARSPQHVNKKLPEVQRRAPAPAAEHVYVPRKASASSRYLTAKTKKYVVNGTNLPDVDFDIGESYAGLMPISNKTNAAELYFWFFPSSNPKAEKEITIWLNGGPGCSSLEGFLQENGPVLWQYGMFESGTLYGRCAPVSWLLTYTQELTNPSQTHTAGRISPIWFGLSNQSAQVSVKARQRLPMKSRSLHNSWASSRTLSTHSPWKVSPSTSLERAMLATTSLISLMVSTPQSSYFLGLSFDSILLCHTENDLPWWNREISTSLLCV